MWTNIIPNFIIFMLLSKDTWLERTAKMLSFNPKSLLRKHTKWSKTWDTGGMVDFQRKVFEKDEFEPRCFSSIAWRALERFSILSKKDEAGLGNHHWRKLSSTNRIKQALTIVVLKSCPKHLIFVFVSILDELYQGSIVSQWCTKQLDAGCVLSITSHARCFIVWQKWASNFLSSRISSWSSSPPPLSSSRSSEDALGH